MHCSRDKAMGVTKVVHAALKPFGKEKVVSVNLDKNDDWELI